MVYFVFDDRKIQRLLQEGDFEGILKVLETPFRTISISSNFTYLGILLSRYEYDISLQHTMELYAVGKNNFILEL
jgi:hypothetical protein